MYMVDRLVINFESVIRNTDNINKYKREISKYGKHTLPTAVAYSPTYEVTITAEVKQKSSVPYIREKYHIDTQRD